MYRSGVEPRRSWCDPLEWRPREYNKRADYLCNQSLDTKGSHEHVDPDVQVCVDLNPNWLLYSDGGCQKQGASAYSWLSCPVVEVCGNYIQFVVAFGYEWVAMDQSSLIDEAQGLDKALGVLCQILGVNPKRS